MQKFKLNESNSARRRFYIHCVDATDGLTAETTQAGGTPQISKNGTTLSALANTLVAIGSGNYYVQLTTGNVNTLGNIIVRYKGTATAEFSDIARIVAYDPYAAAGLGLTNLDATVSSRLPTTHAKVVALTTDRIDNLDNLNAQITSRLGSTAVANADVKKIKGSSGNADNLVTRVDATISSRLPTTHAKVVALTTDRIDNLDNLNAQVSSRMSSTAVPSVSLTKVKGSTSTVDNWVTRIDDEVTSRMSSTAVPSVSVTKVKGSTVRADNLSSMVQYHSTGEATSLGGGWGNKLTLVYERFFHKATQSSTMQKVFKANSTGVIAHSAVSATTALQTRNKASSS